jgi:hypothetical protein
MSKKIIVGIASLPERIDCLMDTINSIYDHVDKIIVGLNNYKYVPSFLQRDKIESHILDNSLGDAAKFYKVDEYKNHYYFACDDDLIYPKDYFSHMIEKADQYHVPVGLHGVIFKHPIRSMYQDRNVYHCLHTLKSDLVVDYIATCAMCIDTSKLSISLKDFKHANMADIWVGDVMNRKNIKPVVISHDKNWLTYNQKMVDGKIHTIWDEWTITKNDKIQTDIVNTWNYINKLNTTI